MDQSKEKPVGMIFAILWYHQNKASKQLWYSSVVKLMAT
jgi:hypothetical protein